MEGSRGLVNLIWHYMASDAVKEKFNKRKEYEVEVVNRIEQIRSKERIYQYLNGIDKVIADGNFSLDEKNKLEEILSHRLGLIDKRTDCFQKLHSMFVNMDEEIEVPAVEEILKLLSELEQEEDVLEEDFKKIVDKKFL